MHTGTQTDLHNKCARIPITVKQKNKNGHTELERKHNAKSRVAILAVLFASICARVIGR